jgi:hypothetical protein
MNDKIKAINNSFNEIYDNALKAIIEVVKANGGFIDTKASTLAPTLYAFYEDFDCNIYRTAIHGLRWDDELGLTLCTDEMLENYQYDKGYCFEYFYDFVEGDDAEHIEDALNDTAYFIEFDGHNLQKNETIQSIISGLAVRL